MTLEVLKVYTQYPSYTQITRAFSPRGGGFYPEGLDWQEKGVDDSPRTQHLYSVLSLSVYPPLQGQEDAENTLRGKRGYRD